jgi:hypothetical protein
VLAASDGLAHAGAMRTDRKWLTIASVVMVMMGCSSSKEASTTIATDPTAPVATPSSTLAPTTTSEVTTTTAEATSTTVEAANVITRPYVDPAVCGSGAMSVYRSEDLTYFPFAVGREEPIPLQVLASSSDGVAKPFAVVLRLSASSRDLPEDHPVLINGTTVGVTVNANGNGAAAWTLPDGTKAYMRSRDLDEGAIVALVTRLTPRDRSTPIPGFDVQPSSDPNALVVLHEHLNTGLSGTVTTFQCQTGFNQGIYRIRAIDGDPVFVYFGIVDAPRPYAAGVNGDGAIAITNTVSQNIALQQITNAEPATWAAIPTIEQG